MVGQSFTTEQQKRDGIFGLFDVQNCDGHNCITSESVDICKHLLEKYPNVYIFSGVQNWNVEETADFIESARVAQDIMHDDIYHTY